MVCFIINPVWILLKIRFVHNRDFLSQNIYLLFIQLYIAQINSWNAYLLILGREWLVNLTATKQARGNISLILVDPKSVQSEQILFQK